jgi:hypothetical protein
MKVVKFFGISVIALVLGGCLSAGTNARLCSDLGFIGKVANAISSKIGSAVGEYTPKKCLNGGVSGDTGNLTGGINIGVNNEPTGNPVPQE